LVKIIAWFEELTKQSLGVAGGKGANLGEMTQAGIPVPPGFVVTAQAYEYFVNETGLFQKILDILEETDVDEAEQLQSAGEKIRNMIKETPMLPDIKEETLKAYKQLSDKTQTPNVHVAVRSSATAEDLPDASFAGQQDTYLNIHGDDQLLDAVQRCWASLFTNRAIFYREKNQFDHSKVLISIIVQEMVNSEAAGVIFTVHPTTSNKNHVYIESSWGLGESVVSGSVTPDTFTVTKDKLQRQTPNNREEHRRKTRTTSKRPRNRQHYRNRRTPRQSQRPIHQRPTRQRTRQNRQNHRRPLPIPPRHRMGPRKRQTLHRTITTRNRILRRRRRKRRSRRS